jgi:hypothetical protein
VTRTVLLKNVAVSYHPRRWTTARGHSQAQVHRYLIQCARSTTKQGLPYSSRSYSDQPAAGLHRRSKVMLESGLRSKLNGRLECRLQTAPACCAGSAEESRSRVAVQWQVQGPRQNLLPVSCLSQLEHETKSWVHWDCSAARSQMTCHISDMQKTPDLPGKQ